MPTFTRHLTFPNLLNVRDLGGCRRRDGGQTRTHALVRADDLSRLTHEGVQALLAYGITTVIDLRWPADANILPNLFHTTPTLVSHQHISLLGASLDTWRSIRPQVPKEQFNCITLDYAQNEIRAVLQAIAAAPPGGVLFHCVSGKDRTGLIAALLLTLADVEPDEIVLDYTCSTENLEAAYLAAFPDEQEATRERVRCPPEQITNMLAYLNDRYGGVADYLHTIGVTAGELVQLQARLLE